MAASPAPPFHSNTTGDTSEPQLDNFRQFVLAMPPFHSNTTGDTSEPQLDIFLQFVLEIGHLTPAYLIIFVADVSHSLVSERVDSDPKKMALEQIGLIEWQWSRSLRARSGGVPIRIWRFY